MDAHIPPPGAGDVANAPISGRKSSLVGDESDQHMLQQWQEQAMQPIKEDLVLWLKKTLEIDDISADDFLGGLDNAVYLCKLSTIIQQKMDDSLAAGDGKGVNGAAKSSCGKIKYRQNATSGTWFARDNTAAFLKWCTDQRIKPECMFETEGLVLHKSERSVILCLLELARLGMKYGLEPPNLIKLEAEIDQLEANSDVFDNASTDDGKDSADGSEVTEDTEGKENNGVEETGTKDNEEELKPTRKAVKNDVVDKKVVEMTSTCRCENCFQVERISEGRYIIGGRNMFVRLLQDRHLMVRVGGGWDTLEHYLDTHDPCRILEFKRNGVTHNRTGRVKDADYLQARGRYKSAGRGGRKMSSAI